MKAARNIFVLGIAPFLLPPSSAAEVPGRAKFLSLRRAFRTSDLNALYFPECSIVNQTSEQELGMIRPCRRSRESSAEVPLAFQDWHDNRCLFIPSIRLSLQSSGAHGSNA